MMNRRKLEGWVRMMAGRGWETERVSKAGRTGRIGGRTKVKQQLKPREQRELRKRMKAGTRKRTGCLKSLLLLPMIRNMLWELVTQAGGATVIARGTATMAAGRRIMEMTQALSSRWWIVDTRVSCRGVGHRHQGRCCSSSSSNLIGSWLEMQQQQQP
jgi:hypothetical protein